LLNIEIHVYDKCVTTILISSKQYLCWVDLALDDIKYRDVAVVGLALDGRGHHHVLWLQQASHDVKNGRLADARHLKINKQDINRSTIINTVKK